MNFFDTLGISASGLSAQRIRMETIASNLANTGTTKTPEGGPYRRRDVFFEAVAPKKFKNELDNAMRGVRVAQIVQDQKPFELRYEPSNPEANAQGYVQYPNVEPSVEMVNMVSATRSYEANLAVIEATKNLMLRTLEI